MKDRLISILFVIFLILAPIKATQVIKGVVFEDVNKDGIQQRNEKSLQNILISDGDTIVKTDIKGMYSLKVSGNSVVFPILPGDFTLAGNNIISGSFFRVKTESTELLTHNFPLQRDNNPKKFGVDVIGDVQVKDKEELTFAQHSILSELVQNKNSEFALFMGDLSNDNDSMLIAIHHLINFLPIKSYHVMGNHDFDESKPRTPRLFRSLFGTDVYAFFKGDACFVILNDNDGFKGNIPSSQIRFLKELIKFIPKTSLLVVSQHVPLDEVSNNGEFLKVIGEHPCLVLSGHTHTVHRKIWNSNVNEWGVGASCGSWWQGERDYTGIPVSLQQCGTPRNFYRLFISGNKYELKFKGVGLDDNYQMDIKIKGQDSLDDSIPSLSEIANGCVVANVYSGCDSTKVEISIDNGNWLPMKHTEMIAPAVSKIIEWNKKKIYPSKFSTKIPLRKQQSPHIWTFQLPKNDNNYHILRIRAYDDYGLGKIEQSLVFNLEKNN